MHLLIILSYKTLKLKSISMNSEKVESWHGIIISPTWHVQKCREGHHKNWMHFVCKLDNLFRSITISNENSSVTRALQCFLNLFELWTSFVFSMRHSKRGHQFQHVLTPFVVFRSFTKLFRELNDREIENHYKMNSGNVETWHGIIMSPA